MYEGNASRFISTPCADLSLRNEICTQGWPMPVGHSFPRKTKRSLGSGLRGSLAVTISRTASWQTSSYGKMGCD
jgi:hypothetical protein